MKAGMYFPRVELALLSHPRSARLLRCQRVAVHQAAVPPNPAPAPILRLPASLHFAGYRLYCTRTFNRGDRWFLYPN